MSSSNSLKFCSYPDADKLFVWYHFSNHWWWRSSVVCWPHSDVTTVMCHDRVSWPVMWHCVTCVRWWSHDHQEGPTANRKPMFMLEKILTTPAHPEHTSSAVYTTARTGHYTSNTLDVNYWLGVNFPLAVRRCLSIIPNLTLICKAVHSNVANHQVYFCRRYFINS